MAASKPFRKASAARPHGSKPSSDLMPILHALNAIHPTMSCHCERWRLAARSKCRACQLWPGWRKSLLSKASTLAKLLIVDELGYVPLSQTGAELPFEIFSERHEQGSTIGAIPHELTVKSRWRL